MFILSVISGLPSKFQRRGKPERKIAQQLAEVLQNHLQQQGVQLRLHRTDRRLYLVRAVEHYAG